MEDLNLVIAKNINKYRKQSNLTQTKLGQMLNFSDKSVSKWEKGESIPDINVLHKMCQIFGITLNDLTNSKNDFVLKKKNSKLIITLLSAGIVWLVATAVFVCFLLFLPSINKIWLPFVYAIPSSAIVLLVFSCIWGTTFLKFITTSIIIWSTALSLCLTISNIWNIFLICIPLQILAMLWFYLIKK